MNTKRSVGIDFMRVFACLSVLVIHVNTLPVLRDNGVVDIGRLTMQCYFCDAVAYFWLITGFFFFSKYDYVKKLKSMVKKQLIPVSVFLLVSFYFYRFINDIRPLSESVSHTREEYENFWRPLLIWDVPKTDGSQPLWFMFVYILLVVVSPVLVAFVKRMDEDTRLERLYIIVSLFVLVLNDFTNNQFAEFSFHGFRGVFAASFFVIWGHIIGKNIDRFTNLKSAIGALCIIVFLNTIRVMLLRYTLSNELGNHLLFWCTSFGLLISICVLVIYNYLFRNVSADSKLGKTVIWLAGFTFPIYIIHFFMIGFLGRRFQFFARLGVKMLTPERDSLINDLQYLFISWIALLTVSFVAVVGMRLIKRCFLKVVCTARKA